MLQLLAEEPRAGRLRIAPRAVFSASEVLRSESHAGATEALGDGAIQVRPASHLQFTCYRRAIRSRTRVGVNTFAAWTPSEWRSSRDAPGALGPGTTAAAEKSRAGQREQSG